MNSNYGFIKVAAAVPHVRVADCTYNAEQIRDLIQKAEEEHVAVICFPELSLTSVTCQDLFRQKVLLDAVEVNLQKLMLSTADYQVIAIIGLPISYGGVLISCAAVFQQGRLLALVPRRFPDGQSGRWFAHSNLSQPLTLTYAGQQVQVLNDPLFSTSGFRFTVTVGSDLASPLSPYAPLCLNGAELIFSPGESRLMAGSTRSVRTHLNALSARLHAACIWAGCGTGESTQDAVYGGDAYIYEDGRCLAGRNPLTHEAGLLITEVDVEKLQYRRRSDSIFTSAYNSLTPVNYNIIDIESTRSFSPETDRLTRTFSKLPFVPQRERLAQRCAEIFPIQVHALAQRITHTHARSLVLGISGGLDSTLALMVCVAACDLLQLSRTTVQGITMPGFGTSDRTLNNALELMDKLGISQRRISIREACLQHFQDIGHNPSVRDVTYENSQARERTQILMDIANQTGGLVVGTGDLSELALGWATYNGDHMSMYGVNASVPKTFIINLVRWIAVQEEWKSVKDVLLDITYTPISPELIPTDEKGSMTQKTEELVGPYELHDFFLFHFLRNGCMPQKILYMACHAFQDDYTPDVIRHWLSTFCRRFFQQQFKRSCLPDGPKVGTCSLSPRADWCMPTDAFSTHWTEDI